MGRSKYIYRHNMMAEESKQVIEAFLSENGFKAKLMKTGEIVWKNGTGILMAPGCLSLYYEDGRTTVFAWIQTGMGLMARSEADLYGVSMALPKRKLTKFLGLLEQKIQSA